LGASGEVHPHLFGTVALRASGVIFVLGFVMYATFIRMYLRRRVDGHTVYVNPSNTFFRIEEDLMIPVFTAIFKWMTVFFRFFDQWLIRLGAFIGDLIHRLADVKPKKWIEMNGSNFSDAGTHLIESLENASSGKFAQPLIEKGDAALGKLTSEKLSEPLHRSGEAIAHLADESLRKGHKLKDEGETTVRKAVYRANFNISTVTYSIFLFGAILVLSFIFIFLNSTLVKY